MMLDDFLAGKQTVAISGHVRPDGDCVGSVLAVYNYIKEYFPQIRVDAYLESVPETFRFLKNADRVHTQAAEDLRADSERQMEDDCQKGSGRQTKNDRQTESNMPAGGNRREKINRRYDLFIALDCGDEQRLGDAVWFFRSASQKICIDHHISNNRFADSNLVDPKASSACELVFRLIETDKISRNVAECLYTGIVTDTGVFQYSSTSSETMRIGGVLMDKGINYSDIVDRVFFRKSFGQLKAEGLAFSKAKKIFDEKGICAVITKQEMLEHGLTGEDLEGIVSELRSVNGVEASLFLHEDPENIWKISMRSASYADVAAVAVKFGGGGHVRAAGATVEGTQEEVLSAVLAELEKEI